MPMRRSAIVGALLFLPACQKAEQAEAPPVQNEIVVRSDNQKALFDLSDLNRAIALKRGIVEQGLACKQVEETGYVGRYKNMDVWNTTCSGDKKWAVFIGADDSVQVRNCADIGTLGLPECKIQPGTEGGSGVEEIKTSKGSGG